MKFEEKREIWLRNIKTMDLPEIRREPTLANLRWFLRNARIRNNLHPKMELAWELAKDLLEDLE